MILISCLVYKPLFTISWATDTRFFFGFSSPVHARQKNIHSENIELRRCSGMALLVY
jgi:hypothetical protein